MARPRIKPEWGSVTEEELFTAMHSYTDDPPNPCLVIWELLHGQFAWMTRREYAATVGMSPRKLQRLIHNWNKEGLLGLCPRLRSGGRPRKMTSALAKQHLEPTLAKLKESGTPSGAALHRQLTHEHGINVGYSTLLRYLQRTRGVL